jgi:hypothetical protein
MSPSPTYFGDTMSNELLDQHRTSEDMVLFPLSSSLDCSRCALLPMLDDPINLQLHRLLLILDHGLLLTKSIETLAPQFSNTHARVVVHTGDKASSKRLL